LNAFLKIAAAACLVTALAGPAACQVTVQEGVSTDTVDLFAKSARPHKSMALAMCASILLPGLGHQYLGDNAKALTYYSTEALFIFGALFCNYYSKTVSDNAKVYAWDHALAAGGAGADDRYWQNVGHYDGVNGYNQEMERIYRSEVNDYLSPNLYWHWDDAANEGPYNNMLQQSLSWQMASSFFLGAMVLNRLVAFIDARFATKQSETKSLSSIQFLPLYNPVARAAGLTLKAGF
jgi:hypothetical protein